MKKKKNSKPQEISSVKFWNPPPVLEGADPWKSRQTKKRPGRPLTVARRKAICTASISPEVDDALGQFALGTDRSKSSIVEEGIRLVLAKYKK